MNAEQLVGQELGGFRLVELLGQGEVSMVYKGESRLARNIVRAIKILKPEFCADEVFAKRFILESSLLETLRHANIVKFYGIRHEEGLLFMELELLRGLCLAETLAGRRRIPVNQVVGWMVAASEGVALPHRNHVVHRDLKPANIFLTDDSRIKVLDFGIARALEEAARITQTRAKPRRSAYIPPEIILGQGWSTRSDVYALALVTYELLLGRYPYPVSDESMSDQYALMEAIANAQPIPIGGIRTGVPDPLLSYLDRCLSKRPSDRPADATEYGYGLQRSLGGEPAPTAGGWTIQGLSKLFGSGRD